jgi:histidinol-phosphate aminotransferase
MTSKPPTAHPLVPPNVERIVPYVPGKPIAEVERELGIHGSIKLASNENPLGPSPLALEAARRALASLHLYPDGSATDLRVALGAHHRVAPEEIVVGNGSAELIELLVRTFCAPGSDDEVLTGDPSFAIYPLAAQAHGVKHVPVRMDAEMRYDVPGLLAAASARTRICFIANPNNPTGTYLPKEGFRTLLEELPPHVILVADEAYIEYVAAPDYPDALALRAQRERLISLRTFSKSHGLAGIRVGYAVAPRALAGYLQRVRSPFNVSSIAQVAALAALGDTQHVEATRALARQGLAFLEPHLARLGVRSCPSQANFVFVDVGRPALDVYQALLRRGVIVRPIGGPRHLRITVGLPAENERLVEALEEVLS